MDTVSGKGDFMSPEFLLSVRKKIELILVHLRENPGETLIWSDVDILFGSISPVAIQTLLDTSHKSILFQQERPGMTDVNTGFYVCRSCAEVVAFFEKVHSRLVEEPGQDDQMAANFLISKENFPWIGTLPPTFYARTHGWPTPSRFAIYHANYTKGGNSVGQKIRQFEEVRFLERFGMPARIWSCLRRIPRKLGRKSATYRGTAAPQTFSQGEE